MLITAQSASSAKNTDRARLFLLHLASKLGAQDPRVVSPQSSTLFLYLLYPYGKAGTNSPLSVDGLHAIFKGLGNFYSAVEHRGILKTDVATSSASANPCKEMKILESYVLVIKCICISQISLRHVCDRYLSHCSFIFHAAMVLGHNVGQFYDEPGKMSI